MTSCCPGWSPKLNGVGGFGGRSLYSRAPNYSDLTYYSGALKHRYIFYCVSVAESCPIFETPWTVRGVSQARPQSPVHGISQARTLEWVAISSSRGSS